MHTLNSRKIEAYAAPRRLIKIWILMRLKRIHKNVLTALLYKRFMMLKAT